MQLGRDYYPTCRALININCLVRIPDLISLAFTVVAKMIRTIVFLPAKNGFKSAVSIFCCSVSVGNISLHFQTLILIMQ